MCCSLHTMNYFLCPTVPLSSVSVFGSSQLNSESPKAKRLSSTGAIPKKGWEGKCVTLPVSGLPMKHSEHVNNQLRIYCPRSPNLTCGRSMLNQYSGMAYTLTPISLILADQDRAGGLQCPLIAPFWSRQLWVCLLVRLLYQPSSGWFTRLWGIFAWRARYCNAIDLYHGVAILMLLPSDLL